ncbi:hypothetical protein OG21DRAFT_441660 [Imleria badia]|nr:hypothetical protein OG21DRAFT_441660 [Imleria badia]
MSTWIGWCLQSSQDEPIWGMTTTTTIQPKNTSKGPFDTSSAPGRSALLIMDALSLYCATWPWQSSLIARSVGPTPASMHPSCCIGKHSIHVILVIQIDQGLAQALVYRYDKQGCEESVAAEVSELMAEVQDACSLGSHEHRAAELVLPTCARCGIINNNSRPVGLDELISELD